LVSTPYLSRVLGADGIGTYSYAYSIVSYFILFAVLGTSTFGQREISYVQENKSKRSLVFWENVLLRFITTVLTLTGYGIYLIVQNADKTIYIIMALQIISVVFDVSWFFQGLEEFDKIIGRNIFFRIINIIYIFLIIKDKQDLYLYALGLGLITMLGNISLWVYIQGYIERVPLRKIRPVRNLRTILSLFIPTVAIQVYTILDKTMIGVFTEDSFENGYYEQAEKIAKMAMAIVTSLGTVMIPRIGFHFGRKETGKVKSYMYRGYRFVWCFGTALCLGLFGIAPNLVPWFFGDGYGKVISLLRIFCFLILSIGINNVTGMQYLIPTKRQNLFTITVLVGAVSNFLMNGILIPRLYSVGAAIASVVAETIIALVQLFVVRKELSFYTIITSARNYFIAGLVMLGLLSIENIWLSSSFFHTCVMAVSGASVYFGVLFLMKDDFFVNNVNNILVKVMHRLKKK